MPNHVTTRCVITGPAERITEFKENHFNAEEERGEARPCFDFNTIVPMPAVIRATTSDSDVDLALYAMGLAPKYGDPLGYKWVKELGITTRQEFAKHWQKEHPDAFVKAELALKAKAETGYTDWYGWSIANWGTKWNSYSFSLVRDEPGELEFVFDTAWSTPEPIYRKLGEMYPDLEFKLASFDEGWNFAQVAIIRAGELLEATIRPDRDTLTAKFHEMVYGEPAEFDGDEPVAESAVPEAIAEILRLTAER